MVLFRQIAQIAQLALLMAACNGLEHPDSNSDPPDYDSGPFDTGTIDTDTPYERSSYIDAPSLFDIVSVDPLTSMWVEVSDCGTSASTGCSYHFKCTRYGDEPCRALWRSRSEEGVSIHLRPTRVSFLAWMPEAPINESVSFFVGVTPEELDAGVEDARRDSFGAQKTFTFSHAASGWNPLNDWATPKEIVLAPKPDGDCWYRDTDNTNCTYGKDENVFTAFGWRYDWGDDTDTDTDSDSDSSVPKAQTVEIIVEDIGWKK